MAAALLWVVFHFPLQIHSAPYRVWGASIPQTSVDPALLRGCGQRVGQACQARGIIGHLSVDFLTFIHPTSVSLDLTSNLS